MATRGFTVLRGGVRDAASMAAAAEAAGYHTTWSPEFYTRSGVVTLAASAHRTTNARLGSGIMYGVGRSPLILATEARSLDELSGGRFVLGLGTGTARMMRDWHGVDPSGPATRMEELITVLRQLWRLHQQPVRHDGRFYHLDLTPTAEMEPPLRTDIPVFTAGVNPRMIEVAGRVADGFLGHPLFSPAYMEQVVRPSVEAGARRSDRAAAQVEVTAVVVCAASENEEQARREAAAQLAFYAVPRTYARVLEVSGFAAAGDAIRQAFARGDLAAMVAAVPDAMIDAMAAAGTPEQVSARLAYWGRQVDHVVVYPASFGLTAERSGELAAELLECAAPGRAAH